MTNRRHQPRAKLPYPQPGDPSRAAHIQSLSDAIQQNWHSEGIQAIKPREIVVILDMELEASSHSKKVRKWAWATICEWDHEKGAWTEPDDYREPEPEPVDDEERDLRNEADPSKEKVWNISEVTTHDKDTFGFARIVGNCPHYLFFGDCDAMAERLLPEDDDEEE